LRLDFRAEEIEKLLLYISEIEKWNKRFKLVKADSYGLVVRHILDSLAALPLLTEGKEKKNILDVGAGAGLPAIPLAIFLNHYSFTLCERSATRAAFLRNVLLLLKLGHVQIQELDVRCLQGHFDTLIFRAVGTVIDLLGQCEHVLTASSVLFAYKGTLARLLQELPALVDHFHHLEIKQLVIPFLQAERHVLTIRLKHRRREIRNSVG
jgi:16S rRNA (guanine527-N7)-methyltransferase